MKSDNKKWDLLMYSLGGIASMVLIAIALNVLFYNINVRLDLTQGHVYTLSAGTKAILAKLDTPVVIRYYVSSPNGPEGAEIKAYAKRIEDLLGEYKQAGHGNITVQKFDPEPDSPAEDSAKLDGVEPQQLSRGGDPVYLGISISCLDKRAVLPFLLPTRERLLEYDISRNIVEVTTAVKPVIGIMSPMQVIGMDMAGVPPMMRSQMPNSEPWIFVTELKRTFDVRPVDMGSDSIPADIKALIVYNPTDISATAQFAIDQFVLRGGRVIAFVDPLCVGQNLLGRQQPFTFNGGTTLGKLFPAWGVQFDPAKVVCDLNYKTQIKDGEDQAAVLSLPREAVNPNDIITGDIQKLVMVFAGSFTGAPAPGIEREVLIHSSKQSQLIDASFAGPNGEKVIADFKSSNEEAALAIRLTGKFKTAFPEGKPAPVADPTGQKPTPPPSKDPVLKEGNGEGVVVLVADADILCDMFAAQVQDLMGQKVVMTTNDNLAFLQNTVEQMTGDSNLIQVRSRGVLFRPFTVVAKMEEEARGKYQQQITALEQAQTEATNRLMSLEAAKTGEQKMVLSPEQQAEIKKLRQAKVETDKQLKQVRLQLRREINSLENWLTIMNILAAPVVVICIGIGVALYRRKQAQPRSRQQRAGRLGLIPSSLP